MPEASMNKDEERRGHDSKVGLSGNIETRRERHAPRPEGAPQSEFRFRVIGADTGHVRASLRWSEPLGHDSSLNPYLV
jgi:hypothetical protein